MTDSIERIRAKCESIKQRRKAFLDKLMELQTTLSEALFEIDIYAHSNDLTLKMTGQDDWIYGHLFYSNGKLKIAYRNTYNDLVDSMNGVHKDEYEFTVKDLNSSPVEWLEKLSTDRGIKSLLSSVEKSLASIEESSISSTRTLEETINSQSLVIFEDATEELISMLDESIHDDWLKARNVMLSDPQESITRSSSYLESVCRMILNDLSIPLPNTLTITSLINSVVKELGLSDDERSGTNLKQLYGGVKSIVQAIGAMRTHFGTAHGSNAGDYVVSESEARLINDAAAAISVFLLKRYKMRNLIG